MVQQRDEKYEAVVFHDNNCLNKSVETYEDVQRFIEARFDDDLSRYHIFVNEDGTISMGESLKQPSVFYSKIDGRVISIYLVGNFVQDQMSREQEQTLIALCVSLYDRFRIHEDQWLLHREVMGGSDVVRFGGQNCPGQNFPIETIRDVVRRERESDERCENRALSEGVQELIETDSLTDTCDAIREISDRLMGHSQTLSRTKDFVEQIAV